MSERLSRRDDWKDSPELQRELRGDSNEELRELHATEQEGEGSGRLEPFPDDERRERQQRRLNPDLDDLE